MAQEQVLHSPRAVSYVHIGDRFLALLQPRKEQLRDAAAIPRRERGAQVKKPPSSPGSEHPAHQPSFATPLAYDSLGLSAPGTWQRLVHPQYPTAFGYYLFPIEQLGKDKGREMCSFVSKDN